MVTLHSLAMIRADPAGVNNVPIALEERLASRTG